MKLRHGPEILVLASALAFALALLLGIHSVAAGPRPQTSQATTPAQVSAVPSEAYEGIVTDTRCGAKHSAKVGLSAADCTRACVHSGERFALIDGEKAYVLEGEPDRLKRLAGERVKIAGTLNGNAIQVASVAEINSRTE
jgi:uncharacterized low-complexity protein